MNHRETVYNEENPYNVLVRCRLNVRGCFTLFILRTSTLVSVTILLIMDQLYHQKLNVYICLLDICENDQLPLIGVQIPRPPKILYLKHNLNLFLFFVGTKVNPRASREVSEELSSLSIKLIILLIHNSDLGWLVLLIGFRLNTYGSVNDSSRYLRSPQSNEPDHMPRL